ncbi:hypothetical protein GL325_02760 [Aeromicrobium sp. 636]|uniref:Uncharacterized protein n=1 Tax=Aeromicrobium senzhongii TaxID=2663859 RepID=A0A8I0ETS0_9ACTN|nr:MULTISPECIES: hypothetical protein [Aeromicrobium]MBC9225237.1 hypothetical protein [Aeromicrobium senzhongii]MCQ3997347.1 hypothetical protein [Aeromicrobium sp. 636]MTB87283.1 hypothetical protein [Aeromicrobium senzhongii]QNL95651.1 hypothetical protein H9L21_07025 [Aeromicrobium senzhongii]
MDFARSVLAALDPLLVPVGFAPGQASDTHVIYCAGHDDLSDRFPGLPQSNDQPRDTGACIDLAVGHGRGVEVDFEGISLPDTFRALRLEEDASRAEELEGVPFEAAMAPLAELLARLLHAAAP